MDAQQFFYEHAGWSYDPKTQTAKQGRQEGAQRLAAAEHWAEQEGIRFVWGQDYHDDGFKDYMPESCEYCEAKDEEGEVLASLGCIDDADMNYRRVVEAELALEAMPDRVKVRGK